MFKKAFNSPEKKLNYSTATGKIKKKLKHYSRYLKIEFNIKHLNTDSSTAGIE